MESTLFKLHKLGQSPWIDNIKRSYITKGGFLRMIKEDGVFGVTSNPSIFEKAIVGSSDYDEDISRLAKEGKGAFEIYDELTVKDIKDAADIFHEVYKNTNGVDGYISLEVNPHFAHDKEKTISEVKRLKEKVAKENVMFKVPATKEGVEAVRELIGEGININVTLIFSLLNYMDVAIAYLEGLKELSRRGGDLSKVASVASVFVSRVDTMIDKKLDELGNKKLKGLAAVANTKMIYQKSKEIFSSDEFKKLEAKGASPARGGARLQRPLWGSTSTKNPAYSDIKYVQELIGKNTVNTIPDETVKAYLDHGKPRLTIEDGLDKEKKALDELRDLGVSLDGVCEALQRDGVAAFEKSFDSLLDSIKGKIDAKILSGKI